MRYPVIFQDESGKCITATYTKNEDGISVSLNNSQINPVAGTDLYQLSWILGTAKQVEVNFTSYTELYFFADFRKTRC